MFLAKILLIPSRKVWSLWEIMFSAKVSIFSSLKKVDVYSGSTWYNYIKLSAIFARTSGLTEVKTLRKEKAF